MPTRRRALLILAALALLALTSLVLALMVGGVHVPLGEVFPALFGSADSMAGAAARALGADAIGVLADLPALLNGLTAADAV